MLPPSISRVADSVAGRQANLVLCSLCTDMHRRVARGGGVRRRAHWQRRLMWASARRPPATTWRTTPLVRCKTTFVGPCLPSSPLLSRAHADVIRWQRCHEMQLVAQGTVSASDLTTAIDRLPQYTCLHLLSLVIMRIQFLPLLPLAARLSLYTGYGGPPCFWISAGRTEHGPAS